MTLYLDEDEAFSLSAYVEAPGYQRVSVSGYLVDRRADGTYIAPFIPALFYDANGNQLQTWRQNLTATGDQVILSRSGGYPKVPREDLYWRKIEEKTPVKTVETAEVPKVAMMEVPSWVLPVVAVIGGIVLLGALIYKK